MPDKLAQILKIFVNGVGEDYGEKVASLMFAGLQAWRKTQEYVGICTKEEFQTQSIELLKKNACLRPEDARMFVQGFLAALDEQLPGFWEIE